jgi:sec-independent protein translocase protein TatA
MEALMLELFIPSIQLAWTPGPFELGVILVVALLLFGSRLPNVMRNMGRGITEFKKGIKDSSQEIKQTIDNSADDNDQQENSSS